MRSWGLALAALLVAPPAMADKTVDECVTAAESAQDLRADGKLTAARDQLLVCASTKCPSSVRKDCSEWLADVERQTPTIVVRAVDDAGSDVVNLKLSIDGKVVSERATGMPLRIDPGEHQVVFESEGKPKVSRTLLVRMGEVNRVVSVTLGSEAAPSSSPLAAIPLPSWILGAAGVVATGVGTAFWIAGKGEHDDLGDTCATTHSCKQEDVDASKSKLLVGDVFLAVGLVGIAAAVALAVVHPNTPPTTRAAQALARGRILSW